MTSSEAAAAGGTAIAILTRKISSMGTILTLIGLAAGGVYRSAQINDQLAAQDKAIAGAYAKADEQAKLVDQDGRRIDALSFRQSAADDRATSLTAAIVALTAEFHNFVHEQDLADRRFSDGLSEIKAMIGQVRTDLSWIERTPQSKRSEPPTPFGIPPH